MRIILPQNNRSFQILQYSTAIFLFWTSLYLYSSTLPVYINLKVNDLALVGTILSMYGFGQAITRLPLGILVDWIGKRKPIIVLGLILSALGALFLGIGTNVNTLIIGRAITGLAAASWVVMVVIFSELFPPEEAVRASGLVTMISSLSRMVASGLNGFLNDWGGFKLAFILSAIVAGFALLVIIPTRENLQISNRPTPTNILGLIRKRSVLIPSLVCIVIQYVNWGGSFGFIPILAKDFGATNLIQSGLTSLSIGFTFLGNLCVATLVKRVGARRMVIMGILLATCGIGIASIAPSLTLIVLAQAMTGLATGIGYPILMGMSIENVNANERASAMGLFQAIYALGMFAGPWMSGILSKSMGIQPMFGITAIFSLAFGLFVSRWLVTSFVDQK